MKKLGVVLFVIAAVVTLSLSGYGLDLGNVKKKTCETACDKTYDECLKKSQQESEKAKDEAKKKAADLACSKSKDECYKNCSK